MQGKASNIVDDASYVCNAEETRETEAESACLCITCRDIMQIQVEEKRHGTWIKFDSGRNKLRATFRLIKERKRYRGAKRSIKDCCIDENDEMDERERESFDLVFLSCYCRECASLAYKQHKELEGQFQLEIEMS